MLYRKIRVSHLDDKTKLYRIFYVPEDIRLSDLASVIRETFRMEEGHLYEFRKGKISYVMKKDDPYGNYDDYGDYDMSRHTIHDPGDQYHFIYDYGDHWEFEVRIYKLTKEIDSNFPVIVLEGKGRGIWEDNRWGYMQLLNGEMPGNLSEDDEENEFYLPWNLGLEHAEDTFEEIDAEEETEYLSQFVSFDENSEDDESVWDEFNDALSKADMFFLNGDDDGTVWIRAFEAFKKTCTSLKEENRLPSKIDEISGIWPDFSGDSFVEDLIDELADHERYSELYQIVNELEGMFEHDDVNGFEIIRGKAEALHGMGDDPQMLSFVQEMYAKYPESDTVRMLMMNAFRYNRKKKDGKQFMEEILKSEPECNEDNYAFYIAAAEFAQYAGMKALTRKLKDSIDAENEREMDEMEEEFGSLDDEKFGFPDDEDFDEDNDDDDEEMRNLYTVGMLRRAIQTYKAEPTESNYSRMVLSLGLAVMNDAVIYFTADTKGSTEKHQQLRMYMDKENDEAFLPLFTEDLGKLPKEMTLFPMRASKILKNVLDIGIMGIFLDTYINEQPIAVLNRDVIADLLRIAGPFEDDEEDLDPEDIPF
ncbi:MAG: hypothetical protein IKG55_06395 [Solobacterium sp.]|nr:hypothetical protein [Solobacterium sp.]